MVVNWSDSATLERVFIATLASLDNKIDVKKIARIYGGEMTYHALENRLRKWKKEAVALKDEVAGITAPAKSPARPRVKKDVSPTKTAVKSGRVTKPRPTVKPKVKREVTDEEEDNMLLDGSDADMGAGVDGGKNDEDVDEFI